MFSLVFEGRPQNKQTIEVTAGAVTEEAPFEGKGHQQENKSSVTMRNSLERISLS